jgi:hypothetical protein
MKYLSALAALTLPLAAASGTLKEKANALSAAHKDSTLFISAVVNIELTAGSNPMLEQALRCARIDGEARTWRLQGSSGGWSR